MEKVAGQDTDRRRRNSSLVRDQDPKFVAEKAANFRLSSVDRFHAKRRQGQARSTAIFKEHDGRWLRKAIDARDRSR